jgi:hypothetical protein
MASAWRIPTRRDRAARDACLDDGAGSVTASSRIMPQASWFIRGGRRSGVDRRRCDCMHPRLLKLLFRACTLDVAMCRISRSHACSWAAVRSA